MRSRVGQLRKWHNPHACSATWSVANTGGQLCRRQTDMNTEYQCSPKRHLVHHKFQSTAVKLYQPNVKTPHHIHVEIHAPPRHFHQQAHSGRANQLHLYDAVIKLLHNRQPVCSFSSL